MRINDNTITKAKVWKLGFQTFASAWPFSERILEHIFCFFKFLDFELQKIDLKN